MGNIYRDTTLNNVSEQDIGKELKVAGWVENIRDHGGVSFIDLRDMYAVLQVVIRDPELLKGIKKEECISIEGLVEKRDEETYNPKIPSGTIELEAKKITMLGQVYSTIPFEVMTSKEVREDVRLKYRYLDLRNEKVKNNMIFRSQVIAFLRQKMTEMGFLEIHIFPFFFQVNYNRYRADNIYHGKKYDKRTNHLLPIEACEHNSLLFFCKYTLFLCIQTIKKTKRTVRC